MNDRIKQLFCENKKVSIKKKFVFELWDGTKIYLVSGTDIRNSGNTSFIGGGHGYDADGVTPSDSPKNEIWIEEMKNSEDQMFILMHELIEYFQMKYHHVKYEKAHSIANSCEEAVRAMKKLNK